MNIKEFKTRLAKHDWYYSSSEDMRWWEAGLAEENTLKEIMKGKVTYEQAYKREYDKHFKHERSSK